MDQSFWTIAPQWTTAVSALAAAATFTVTQRAAWLRHARAVSHEIALDSRLGYLDLRVTNDGSEPVHRVQFRIYPTGSTGVEGEHIGEWYAVNRIGPGETYVARILKNQVEEVSRCEREEVEARVEFRDVNWRSWVLTPSGKPKYVWRGWKRVHEQHLAFEGKIPMAKLESPGEGD